MVEAARILGGGGAFTPPCPPPHWIKPWFPTDDDMSGVNSSVGTSTSTKKMDSATHDGISLLDEDYMIFGN